MGVTGARTSVSDAAAYDIVRRAREVTDAARLRRARGVHPRAGRRDLAGVADGVIVGSALVACFPDSTGNSRSEAEPRWALAAQPASSPRGSERAVDEPGRAKDVVGLLARLILGGVLIYAGAVKVGNPAHLAAGGPGL
jgi:hypothetical protein